MSTKNEAKVVEYVAQIARTLTSWEAESCRLKWPDARESVARKAGIAPSALDRLERGTLKFADRIGRALDELFIRTTERQIADLERQMAMARARRDGQRPIDAVAVQAKIEEIRRLIGQTGE